MIWTTRARPDRDPKLHRYERLAGVGYISRWLVTKAIIGLFTRYDCVLIYTNKIMRVTVRAIKII
jgi:hypothetical protein